MENLSFNRDRRQELEATREEKEFQKDVPEFASGGGGARVRYDDVDAGGDFRRRYQS
jgi:hypothetical protein